MIWKRNPYGAQSWGEFITAWVFILVAWPVGLILMGLVFKLMWNCLKFGWSLV